MTSKKLLIILISLLVEDTCWPRFDIILSTISLVYFIASLLRVLKQRFTQSETGFCVCAWGPSSEAVRHLKEKKEPIFNIVAGGGVQLA